MMKTIKPCSILLSFALILGALTSCNKINERLDKFDQRLDKLENSNVASVNTQITNITNSIPGLEQSVAELEEYVSLLKQEKSPEFSTSIVKIEQYITNLKVQLTEIKNYTQNITYQENVNNEMWVDITIKTMNLYQSIQNQLSLVKVEVSNVKQMISELKIEVNQKLLDFNLTLLTIINHTEASIMNWVNQRFTAYYTIAEVNARIQNLIIENNVDINASIEALSVMINEMNVEISNIYEKTIQEAILYYDGEITEMLNQKIEEATININVSIESINSRIVEIENRILIIDNSINTVNQQITAINVSIDQMTVLQEQITQYITVLQQEGDTYNTQITLLQQIQNDLTVKIQELNVYVDNIVNNFNTTIIDTKNWVSITFATIEQYNTINTTIINIQAIINVVQTNILEINQSIVNINSNITNIQNNITISITNLDNSTREWVNKRLAEYMTIRAADEQYALLEAQIQSLYDYIRDTDEEALLAKLEELDVELTDMKTYLEGIVKDAVAEAIINHDGNIEDELLKLAAAMTEFKAIFENKIAHVEDWLDYLNAVIQEVEAEIYDIRKELYENVQTITPIPTYSDGSVEVSPGISAIEFEVFPILSQKTVNADSFVKFLHFDVMEVKTKAGSPANPLINLSVTKAEMSGDFLKVYIDFSDLNSFFSGNQALVGRLCFQSGELFKTSGFFPLYPQSRTSANLAAHFLSKVPGSSEVSSIAFKYKDYTVTSGAEVQTSDSPEKIYANISGDTMTISTPASEIYAPEDCSDMFSGKSMVYLTSLDFGTGFNTSRMRDISQMFYCTKISKLDLSTFDFSNVNNMNHLFCYAEDLTYLDFGTKNLPVIKNVSSMCKRIAEYSGNCTIRCNSLTQKVLCEPDASLDQSRIKWVLTD